MLKVQLNCIYNIIKLSMGAYTVWENSPSLEWGGIAFQGKI
jgi:hypothetical protein